MFLEKSRNTDLQDVMTRCSLASYDGGQLVNRSAGVGAGAGRIGAWTHGRMDAWTHGHMDAWTHAVFFSLAVSSTCTSSLSPFLFCQVPTSLLYIACHSLFTSTYTQSPRTQLMPFIYFYNSFFDLYHCIIVLHITPVYPHVFHLLKHYNIQHHVM